MSHERKTSQLQIRLTAGEKAALQWEAHRAGMDLSAYVLSRAVPAAASKFANCLEACRDLGSAKFELAELNALLTNLTAGELAEAVATAPPRRMDHDLLNYVAAMVELACSNAGIPTPLWTSEIAPLEEPCFGSELMSLRLHLLMKSPPPFRRRNIFVDATLGAQV